MLNGEKLLAPLERFSAGLRGDRVSAVLLEGKVRDAGSAAGGSVQRDIMEGRLSAAAAWMWQEAVWLTGWLAVGMLARFWAFGWFPVREDEALYAYWARLVSSGIDPMLEHVAVDKPPLFIYMVAKFFTWLGPTLTAGRLLNELCSLLALLLLWALARRMYGPRTARIALALFALAPFAISFAPTLYVDPMLTAWLLLALLLASYGLGLGAGLALGMAFATKQNAVLLAPLVVGALLIAAPPVWWRWAEDRVRRREDGGRVGAVLGSRAAGTVVALAAAALGFYYIWFKVWQWDGWRILPAEIPNFWQQAWNTYGGFGLAPVAAWPERLAAWVQVWRWLGGWTVGTVVLLGLAAVAVGETLREGTRAMPGDHRKGDHRGSPLRWTWLLAGFTALYLGGHVVFTFQAWDRYLLPLAPILALLAARGLEVGWMRWRWGQGPRLLVMGAVALALLWGAGQATWARIPVGGDHGAYSGIETVAAYLHEHVPARRGVLYQRWLGWQWDWYLWDGPAGRVYWSAPGMVTADLAADPFGYDRTIVFPAWQEAERPALETALAPYHLALTPRLVVRGADGAVRFTVYHFDRTDGP